MIITIKKVLCFKFIFTAFFKKKFFFIILSSDFLNVFSYITHTLRLAHFVCMLFFFFFLNKKSTFKVSYSK